MRLLMRNFFALVLVAGCALLSGCWGSTPAPQKTDAPAAVEKAVPMNSTDELRRKADLTEAASLVGYDGKAIKEDLHKVIDAQQEAAKRLEDLNNIR